MPDRVVVYGDAAGEYRWHRVAGNGELISQGESHPREADALRAARRANRDLYPEPQD